MRVLFLLRRIDTNNGITSYCDTLASGLVASGVPVDFAVGRLYRYPNDEGKWESLSRRPEDIRYFKRLRGVPGPITLVQLVRYVRHRDITVINIHGLGLLIWGKLLKAVTGLPVVATYHPSVHGEVGKISALANRPLSRRERIVLRLCPPDRLVVLSKQSADFLTDQCPSIASRITVIYGAVDEQYFRPPTHDERASARLNLGVSSDTLVILQVGRMSWNKGHDLLMEAVRSVRDNSAPRQISCLFVGSGDDEDQIRRAAFQGPRDSDTFRFLGFVQDLRAVLWAGDVFVLPSRLEGFALAVVEAMSSGLVAVRTPSGGAEEQILDGETGVIVPFENSPKIAEAIRLLAEPRTHAAFQARSLNYAQQNFSKEVLTARMVRVYNDALKA